MRLGKDDWAFRVNGKTSELEIHIPKRDSYSFDEFGNVAVALMRFCAPIGTLFDYGLKKSKKELKKSTK